MTFFCVATTKEQKSARRWFRSVFAQQQAVHMDGADVDLTRIEELRDNPKLQWILSSSLSAGAVCGFCRGLLSKIRAFATLSGRWPPNTGAP